jgi:hypothetical protein
MDHMTDGDLLSEAVAELYSSDPDEFVERRGALVARAREARQAPAAKQIAALRKPTRSAWVVNRLVRADPDATAELASLGEELRTAQGSLDGAAIRELSQRRRALIDSLARRAFTAAGLAAPPAGVRDEVTSTLGAALADPRFAETLADGALVRPVQAEGFGPVGQPTLTLVRGGGGGGRASGGGGRAAGGGGRAPRGKTSQAAGPVRPAAPSAEEVRAERERRHRAAVAEAEQAAAEAAEAADAATAAEHELEATVERLEEELADGRQALADARVQARRARTRQRSAQQALDRLRG